MITLFQSLQLLQDGQCAVNSVWSSSRKFGNLSSRGLSLSNLKDLCTTLFWFGDDVKLSIKSVQFPPQIESAPR